MIQRLSCVEEGGWGTYHAWRPWTVPKVFFKPLMRLSRSKDAKNGPLSFASVATILKIMNDEIYVTVVTSGHTKAWRLLPPDMFCKFYVKYSSYII